MDERIVVKGGNERGEAAHVARGAAEQIIDGFRWQLEGACLGLRGQSGGLFAVGERVQAADQARAKPGAQILAQC